MKNKKKMAEVLKKMMSGKSEMLSKRMKKDDYEEIEKPKMMGIEISIGKPEMEYDEDDDKKKMSLMDRLKKLKNKKV